MVLGDADTVTNLVPVLFIHMFAAKVLVDEVVDPTLNDVTLTGNVLMWVARLIALKNRRDI